MPKIRSILSLLALGLFLAACGGDSPTTPGGNNNDDDGDPGTGGETRSIKADPSFASDVFEVFTRRGCTASGCHGTQGGLTLSPAATAYSQLVGVASTGTGEVRVIAGDAANSYLVKKLEGTATVGARMPQGGSPLDNIDLQNVKNWINQGAKNN